MKQRIADFWNLDKYFKDECYCCGDTRLALDYPPNRTLIKDDNHIDKIHPFDPDTYMSFCDDCLYVDGGYRCEDCGRVYTWWKTKFFGGQENNALLNKLWSKYGTNETTELSECSNAYCKDCADCDET
tara:strand:- start:2350 stop:2733 length:384 start_codon:yes stop_codon:yes gene_type:complete